jgi:hypothetical protein
MSREGFGYAGEPLPDPEQELIRLARLSTENRARVQETREARRRLIPTDTHARTPDYCGPSGLSSFRPTARPSLRRRFAAALAAFREPD